MHGGPGFTITKDTIRLVWFRQLSIRQVWFYGELKKGNSPGLTDLIRFWDIGEATAKRDLSDLVRLGLIRFVGTKRSGYYEIQ